MTPLEIISISIIAILAIALIRKTSKVELFRSEFEFYEKYFHEHKCEKEPPKNSGIVLKRYYDALREAAQKKEANVMLLEEYKKLVERKDEMRENHKLTIDTLDQEIRDQIERISTLTRENSELRQKLNKL